MSQSTMQNFNAEAFLNHWWSASSVPLGFDIEEGIEKTYLDPEGFKKDLLFPRQEQLLPPPQSQLSESYHFYHDCVIRHLRSKRAALLLVKESGEVEEWSYVKLHECVNYHVDKWSYNSLEPGQLIAIVGESDLFFVISLLTALRLGLKICYFPTHTPFLGKEEIRKFLIEIQPQWIVAKESFFLIDGVTGLHLNENGSDEEEYTPLSFAYPANKDVQIALGLQDQKPLAFVSLSAEASYVHALREGLFTFDLPQHPYWAAPLACPIRSEPCSTLMSLLCGATRVSVSDQTIRQNPQLLKDERVNLMGISPALQELWSRFPGCLPTKHLKSCYKSPLNANFQSWKTFLLLNRLEKLPHFNVWMDNAMGGASLFSRPSLDGFSLYLKPTLGSSWSLAPLEGGSEVMAGFGAFQIVGRLSNFTVSQIEQNLMLTGFVQPCRDGVTFPLLEIEQLINRLPFVEASMMHHTPKSGAMFSRYFVLLVFVNPLDENRAAMEGNWSEEIFNVIKSELGQGFLPDHIEYFPLIPKKGLLGIDRAWCANQYQSGLLARKRELSYFQILNRLKKLAMKMAP